MGRIKRGLDYFPINTDFIHDRMVRRIMKHEGDTAFVILVETYSYIYAGYGYYITADEEFYDELADNLFNADLEDVRRVIALAVEYGLFDAEIFRQHGILTSADIQRQYLFIARRRSGSLIHPDYCLLEAEEVESYRSAKSGKKALSPFVAAEEEGSASVHAADAETAPPCAVTSSGDSVTSEAEMSTSGTQNKRKENKEKQNKTNNLPNPPQGGDEGRREGGNILKKTKVLTQEDIDSLQIPDDGTQRNFQGLVENLRLYKIPPSEQYAIIRKSNYGAIGGDVWKGIGVVRGSNGKIRLPGHYLLSVIK